MKKKFLYELKMQLILTIILLILGYLLCKIGAFIQNMKHPILLAPIAIICIYKFLREGVEG